MRYAVHPLTQALRLGIAFLRFEYQSESSRPASVEDDPDPAPMNEPQRSESWPPMDYPMVLLS